MFVTCGRKLCFSRWTLFSRGCCNGGYISLHISFLLVISMGGYLGLVLLASALRCILLLIGRI